MNVTEKKNFSTDQLETADKWILSRLQETIRALSEHMEDGDFGLAATKIYDFAWSEFCDWYIELSKSRLLGPDGESKETAKAVLLHVLTDLLKLLHPFMPFLTEQVYKYLPESEGFLMLQKWPEAKTELDFAEDERKMQGVMEVIRAIRNLRSEMNVAPSKRTRLMLLPGEGWEETLRGGEGYFRKLAGAEQVELISDPNQVSEKTVSAVTATGTLYIPLGDLVDFEKEILRLTKEQERLQKEIERAEGKLSNAGFISKAPAQLVAQEKEKLEMNRQKAEALVSRIAELKESL
jgi:valyl-tRNA synthetase